jgi:hypothetical protein
MDLCADAPCSDPDRDLGTFMSSSDIVYLIALDRSAEGYYGLRARVTGGNIRILSSPEAD